MFEDKTLVCKDCGKEFVWTAGEQEFYAATAVSVRCSMLSAQLAARLARSPSSPVRTVRSTALTASLA